MSYCINPRCSAPRDPSNLDNRICRHCGSPLLLLDRYRATRILSDDSGFAVVYEISNGVRHQILKALKPRHNTNPKVVELFQQEAHILSQLNHPGIPQVSPNSYFLYQPRDGGEAIHCFIMEKIDGPNLKEWMHQQGDFCISEIQALHWLKQLAEILQVVHQKNFFHRDIKLQNIMLRPNGQLVLIDFGAAREMSYTYLARMGRSSQMTKISSAGYTPPEQEKGHAVPQSDFYALGRTFVYLLTGQPFVCGSEFYNPLTDELSWRQYAPDLSTEFADFLDRMMAPQAIQRPKDTREIIETINRLLQRNRDGKPPDRGRRILLTEIQVSPDTPTMTQGGDRESWMQLALKIALPIGLLLGGYGAWQAYRERFVPKPIRQVAIAQTLVGHESFINDAILSADGRQVISGSADKTIKIWDLSQGKLLRTLVGHDSFINHLAVSLDGQWLISGSADKTIKIWDLRSGTLGRTLVGHGNYINALAIAPDGQTLTSTSADGTIRVWDLASAQSKFVLRGHAGFINAIAIAPDGATLASGSADKTVKVWDLNSGRALYTLAGHTGFVNAIAIAPDGETLASGSADKTIIIWNLRTRSLLRILTGHASFINDLAISPDGRLLASSSADKTIKVWELATGKLRHTLVGHANYVNQIAISRDGQNLISSSADKTIRFWDLETGNATATLIGYNHYIDYFDLSADGKTVATGSGSKNVEVWQLETKD